MQTDQTVEVRAPLGFFGRMARILPGTALAVLVLVTLGWMVAQPPDPDMAITFVGQPRGIWAVWPAIAVLTAVMAAVATLIAGRRSPEAGMFAAGAALAVLATRGGSMRVLLGYTVEEASTEVRRALMGQMLLDSLLWAAVMAVAWIAVVWAYRWIWESDESDAESAKNPEPEPFLRGMPKAAWAAVAITTVVALFVIWAGIARTPVSMIVRGQVIGMVALGLFLGAMTARYFTGMSDARWYTLAVPIVAVVAYVLGYMQADMSWAVGAFRPYAALAITPPHNLVRALPIEYFGAGVAGVLAGFWSGERVEYAAVHELS